MFGSLTELPDVWEFMNIIIRARLTQLFKIMNIITVFLVFAIKGYAWKGQQHDVIHFEAVRTTRYAHLSPTSDQQRCTEVCR